MRYLMQAPVDRAALLGDLEAMPAFLEALAAFRAARRDNLAALRALGEEEWTRAGTQEGVGPVTLCDVPAMMREHDAGHREEMRGWQAARLRRAPGPRS
jgi:hypothetical protein